MRMTRSVLLVGAVVAIWLAVGSAWVASSAPDGLERVADDQAFLDRAVDAPFSVLPDYTVPGIANERLSTAVAGVIGVALVLVLTIGLGRLLRIGRPADEHNPAQPRGR